MFVKIGKNVVNADCIRYLSVGPKKIEICLINNENTLAVFFKSDEERDTELERVSTVLCFDSPEEVECEEEPDDEEAPREDL